MANSAKAKIRKKNLDMRDLSYVMRARKVHSAIHFSLAYQIIYEAGSAMVPLCPLYP